MLWKMARGSALIWLMMPTSSSTFRSMRLSWLRQSTCSSFSSSSSQCSHPCLLLSMWSNSVFTSWEVIVGSTSRSIARTWKKFTFYVRCFCSRAVQSMCRFCPQCCSFWQIRRTQSSTSTRSAWCPACLAAMSGWLNTSCHPMRRSSWTVRLFLRKSLVFWPILASQGKVRGRWKMPWRYSSSERQGQGGYPNIISQSISPRLHTSLLAVQGWLVSSWGAMQIGVPQTSFSFFLALMSAAVANPKSATLYFLSLTRTLAGLMSRWMQPLSTSTRMPIMMSSKMWTQSGSAYLWEASSLRRSESHSSRMMQVQRLPMRWSSMLTVCSELHSVVMAISPFSEFISCGSWLKCSIFICLMAQNCPSCLLWALKTRPKAPSPRNTLLAQSYLSWQGNSSSYIPTKISYHTTHPLYDLPPSNVHIAQNISPLQISTTG